MKKRKIVRHDPAWYKRRKKKIDRQLNYYHMTYETVGHYWSISRQRVHQIAMEIRAEKRAKRVKKLRATAWEAIDAMRLY